ncbi:MULTISPECIES: ABC transporter ATP-binding protein [Ramlibacter]|uniref:ATP-binding cassette domain-containing protein n=1 Tax=Ramlibacter pinisoli TaxID=2682844 RepID=A0A6N8IUB8_9BURK|nr:MULTISPECIES: ABC transporter ATP-binding protein [Ramlibacter]MBA2965452.1 ABC transporter ATP-binding protein [Ramlibacter sp. CGMCC 1.13660]MVQ30418.1 ATP-binding cassette domain-containing protein [Ramlibacter pinisoli]
MSAPHGSALLELRGVEKRYANGTVAVQDLSVAIGRHEFVSFLGPSGCGKSTALKMIAGLSAPSGGEIRWGAAPAGGGGTGHAIGFVFQEPTLMPWATVVDNVWLPLRLAGVSRAAARADIEAVLATVGLSQFAHVYPRELSGGMKMRVSIARAMVTRPRVLLMDEPFAALDEMTRFKLNNDTLALWQANPFTTLFVTHSVYEAVYLSTRIVVMAARPGRVVSEIAVDEPYPRSEAFRTSARYNALCVQVSGALQAAGATHG